MEHSKGLAYQLQGGAGRSGQSCGVMVVVLEESCIGPVMAVQMTDGQTKAVQIPSLTSQMVNFLAGIGRSRIAQQ